MGRLGPRRLRCGASICVERWVTVEVVPALRQGGTPYTPASTFAQRSFLLRHLLPVKQAYYTFSPSPLSSPNPLPPACSPPNMFAILILTLAATFAQAATLSPTSTSSPRSALGVQYVRFTRNCSPCYLGFAEFQLFTKDGINVALRSAATASGGMLSNLGANCVPANCVDGDISNNVLLSSMAFPWLEFYMGAPLNTSTLSSLTLFVNPIGITGDNAWTPNGIIISFLDSNRNLAGNPISIGTYAGGWTSGLTNYSTLLNSTVFPSIYVPATLSTTPSSFPTPLATPTPGVFTGVGASMYLSATSLGSSAAACNGTPIMLWHNSVPTSPSIPLPDLFAADADVNHAPPVTEWDDTGQCVAKFTAANQNMLVVPGLDLSQPNQPYSVTLVARMKAGGTHGRALSNFVPYGVGCCYDTLGDWLLGYWINRMDMAHFYSSGIANDWVGGGQSDGYQHYVGYDDFTWIMYTVTRAAPVNGPGLVPTVAGEAKLYKNGNLVGTGVLRGGPFGFTLGAYGWDGGGEFSDVSIGAVIAHPYVLSDSERQQMEGTLARQFQLTNRLPSIHPFFSLAVSAATFPGMPVQPTLWLRPEELPASGSVSAWPNAGTGGSRLSAVSYGDTFPNTTSANVTRPFSSVHFTTCCGITKIVTNIAMSGNQQPWTTVHVARPVGPKFRSSLNSYENTNFIAGINNWNENNDKYNGVYYGSNWILGVISSQIPVPSAGWMVSTVTHSAASTSTSTDNVMSYYFMGAFIGATCPTCGTQGFGFNGLTLGGCYNDDPLVSCSDVDIAEVLVFNTSLSSAQRISVEAYLAQRYEFAIPGWSANSAVTLSPSNPPSATFSPTVSLGSSATSSPTATATPLRCAVDAAFSSGIPSTWTAYPASLVTTVTSSPPRGTGSTITDPLNTGSPFAYLLSGTLSNYTTLSFVVQSTATEATFSASVQFDAGDELPYNADSFVSILPETQSIQSSPFVCGTAVNEGDAAVVTCPTGTQIVSIPFASYGNPDFEGCGLGLQSIGVCHAPSSAAVVSAACIGQPTCSVTKLATTFGASAVCSPLSAFTKLTSLVYVAQCSQPIPVNVWSSNVTSVGAYGQSGWRRVTAQLPPGAYKITFGVRAFGRAIPSYASALAVDNVLVCLSQQPTPVVTFTPSPSPLAGGMIASTTCPSVLSSGAAHTCGITRFHNLLCFGDNSQGQSSIPNILSLVNVSAVSAGNYHTCAVAELNGAVVCFGQNNRGQTTVPLQLGNGVMPVATVSCGWEFSCALTMTGEAMCWGSNDYNKADPPPSMRFGAVAIAAGPDFACGVTNTLTVVCWGQSVVQPPAAASPATMVGAYNNRQACSLTTSGAVVCWFLDTTSAYNLYGNWISPPTSPAIFSNFIAVTLSSSGWTPYAVSTSGDVWVQGPSLSWSFLSSGAVAVTSGGAFWSTYSNAFVSWSSSGGFYCAQLPNGQLNCTGMAGGTAPTPPLAQPFVLPCLRQMPSATPTPIAFVPIVSNCTIGISSSVPAESCYAAYLSCGATNRTMWIAPAGGAAYQAWCGFDGWTLAATVGNSGVFAYESGFWTNSTLRAEFAFPPNKTEAKFKPFLDTPFNSIMLVSTTNETSKVVTNVTLNMLSQPSLQSMFAANVFIPTAAGHKAWISLLGESNQLNCNLEGVQTGSARIGIIYNDQNDCSSCDSWAGIGQKYGSVITGLYGTSFPTNIIRVYIRGPSPTAAPGSVTPTPTATLSRGASPSGTGTAVVTTTSTPASTRAASPSYTPTGTLTVNATPSSTATPSWTQTTTATPSVSPYCQLSLYTYYPSYDVVGNATLAAAAVASERDCAVSCCNTPTCDGYSFVTTSPSINCYLTANVTGIIPSHAFTAGVRTRALG